MDPLTIAVVLGFALEWYLGRTKRVDANSIPDLAGHMVKRAVGAAMGKATGQK